MVVLFTYDYICILDHNLKKTELIETESRLVFARERGMGKMGKGGYMIQTSRY